MNFGFRIRIANETRCESSTNKRNRDQKALTALITVFIKSEGIHRKFN